MPAFNSKETFTSAAALVSVLGDDSNYLIDAVFWSGVVLLTLTLLLLANVLLLRIFLIRRERLNRVVVERWRPVLFECIEGVPQSIPQLSALEAQAFLSLWGHLYDNLLDLARDNLVQVALAVQADRYARKMLRKGNLHAKLIAATALGQMRASTAWDELARLLELTEPSISLAAAKALVRIDAPRALPLLMKFIGTRADWSAARISDVLREAGADLLSGQLAQAALNASWDKEAVASPASAARFIRHLELAHANVAVPALRQLLEATHHINMDVLEACLKLTGNPDDVFAARACISHPHWRVRLQAVGALGRIGSVEEDEKRMIFLLNDPEWWVRYRSAQVLSQLYNNDDERMRETQTRHHDNFARDILGHVIAENRLANSF